MSRRNDGCGEGVVMSFVIDDELYQDMVICRRGAKVQRKMGSVWNCANLTGFWDFRERLASADAGDGFED